MWSQRNIDLVERLTAEDRMKPEGLAAFAHATLPRGTFHTPLFMPVGMLGTVKAMTTDEVASLGAEISPANPMVATCRSPSRRWCSPEDRRQEEKRHRAINHRAGLHEEIVSVDGGIAVTFGKTSMKLRLVGTTLLPCRWLRLDRSILYQIEGQARLPS